jgi:acetyl esterase/lipase
MSEFHQDLGIARFIPQFSFGPRLVKLIGRRKASAPAVPDDMLIENVNAPARDGHPAVSVRTYRRKNLTGVTPALFWLHGGGYIIGSPEQDERTSIAFARELGITVVAARYRLAPEHPAPAAVEDAYAALLWTVEQAERLSIDPARIAIGGASAGGGLAASLVLYAHDRGTVTPLFQLLQYPMLDDRTVLRTDLDTRNARIWSPGSNRFAWTSYLGEAPGAADVSPYSAPARRDDLSGLPSAWVGVGSLDLFYEEDLAYAARLKESGVPCELTVVPGAFHGFDALFAKAEVSKAFLAEEMRVLRTAFAR